MAGNVNETVSSVLILIINKVEKTFDLYNIEIYSSIKMLDVASHNKTIKAVKINTDNNGVANSSLDPSENRVYQYLEASGSPGYVMIHPADTWLKKDTNKTLYRNDTMSFGLIPSLNVSVVASADGDVKIISLKNNIDWKTQLSNLLENLIFSQYREGEEFTARKLLVRKETTLQVYHEIMCIMGQKKLMFPFVMDSETESGVQEKLANMLHRAEVEKHGLNVMRKMVGFVDNVKLKYDDSRKLLSGYFGKSPKEFEMQEFERTNEVLDEQKKTELVVNPDDNDKGKYKKKEAGQEMNDLDGISKMFESSRTNLERSSIETSHFKTVPNPSKKPIDVQGLSGKRYMGDLVELSGGNNETRLKQLERKYTRLEFFKGLFLDLELLKSMFAESDNNQSKENPKGYEYYISKAALEYQDIMKAQMGGEEELNDDDEKSFEEVAGEESQD